MLLETGAPGEQCADVYAIDELDNRIAEIEAQSTTAGRAEMIIVYN
jgi:hypothetical protein